MKSVGAHKISRTYTRCLRELDAGFLPTWSAREAPLIAKKYWRLKEGAKMRDVLLVIRADEANHRLVNHTFSGLETTDRNPFIGGGGHSGTEKKGQQSAK